MEIVLLVVAGKILGDVVQNYLRSGRRALIRTAMRRLHQKAWVFVFWLVSVEAEKEALRTVALRRMHDISEPLDPGITPVVELLRQAGVNTFSSCQGGEGHAFPVPTIRISPLDPRNMQGEIKRIAQILSSAGHSGYYLKQVEAYQAEPVPWWPQQKSFIEIEFWGDQPSNP